MSKTSRRRSPGSRDERRATIAAKRDFTEDDLTVVCRTCSSILDFDVEFMENMWTRRCAYCGIVDAEAALVFKSLLPAREVRRAIGKTSRIKRKALRA